jgi:hypothetical protein
MPFCPSEKKFFVSMLSRNYLAVVKYRESTKADALGIIKP